MSDLQYDQNDSTLQVVTILANASAPVTPRRYALNTTQTAEHQLEQG